METKCPVDCGDSNCECASDRSGMRTNGGCRCLSYRHKTPYELERTAKQAVRYWRNRATDYILLEEKIEKIIKRYYGDDEVAEETTKEIVKSLINGR